MTGPGAVAVVLAAGKGTRMKSDLAKVLFPAAGRTLVEHVLEAVDEAGIGRTVVIVGHQADAVRATLAGRGVDFALQEEQLGTGHAVLMAAPLLEGVRGTAVVLAGDAPLVRPATLRALVSRREESGAAVVVLTAVVPDAAGYGRVLRAPDGSVTRIVEHKDATPGERAVREINSSIYSFDVPFLLDVLPRLSAENAQGEYYLTDAVALAVAAGRRVEALVVDDPAEVEGVNTPEQLAWVADVLRARKGEA